MVDTLKELGLNMNYEGMAVSTHEEIAYPQINYNPCTKGTQQNGTLFIDDIL